MTEVVGFSEIKRHVDGNTVFWNAMRKKAKVKQQKVTAPVDPNAKLNSETNALDEVS